MTWQGSRIAFAAVAFFFGCEKVSLLLVKHINACCNIRVHSLVIIIINIIKKRTINYLSIWLCDYYYVETLRTDRLRNRHILWKIIKMHACFLAPCRFLRCCCVLYMNVRVFSFAGWLSILHVASSFAVPRKRVQIFIGFSFSKLWCL